MKFNRLMEAFKAPSSNEQFERYNKTIGAEYKNFIKRIKFNEFKTDDIDNETPLRKWEILDLQASLFFQIHDNFISNDIHVVEENSSLKLYQSVTGVNSDSLICRLWIRPFISSRVGNHITISGNAYLENSSKIKITGKLARYNFDDFITDEFIYDCLYKYVAEGNLSIMKYDPESWGDISMGKLSWD